MGKSSSLSFGGFCNHSIRKLVATAQIPRALPLKWLTNTPKWAEPWPLPQMKLEALEQLAQEQLQLGHIEPSNSPIGSIRFLTSRKSVNILHFPDFFFITKTGEFQGEVEGSI